MATFFIAVAALIGGYFIYGTFVDKVFGSNGDRAVPAKSLADGVDYMEMSSAKVFLIQLLNIAGLGPIFGPILGALYGPAALLWVVIGSIFAGAVHDYFSGMLSVRQNGDSIPNVVGKQLGLSAKQFMNIFSIILLLLVGVVFVLGPAKLLGKMTGLNATMWVAIIFAYYFLATILPIDKIIGRVYPLFGAVLIFMAVGLTTALFVQGYDVIPNLNMENMHPKELPMWPLMFITIACGAISGFHSTQSPVMARCLKNEKAGKPIFYGSMIGEGLIALVWVTLGMSFYQNPEALNGALAQGGPAFVVNEISTTLLGTFGGFLAVIGVIALPITSGDTAFRSARLIIADFTKVSQKVPMKRLYLAVPLFFIGFLISLADFGVIWRYFGFANQALASIVLWASAVYLAKEKKLHWIASIPATFMTAVVITYLANAKIGFGINIETSIYVGIAGAAATFAFFMFKMMMGDSRATSETAEKTA